MVDPVAGAGHVSAEVASKESSTVETGKQSSPFDEVLEAEGGPDATSAAGPDGIDAVDEVSHTEGNRLSRVIESMQSERASLEQTMDRVMSGQDLDQAEMLEMQALVYQYSQRVELTSKVVEKATGGLKQMLNMQV
mgnify:CR=1 FL=1